MTNESLITVLGLFIANATMIIPLFLWVRTESRTDIRAINALILEIQKEMKDFHNRLCKIEAERK